MKRLLYKRLAVCAGVIFVMAMSVSAQDQHLASRNRIIGQTDTTAIPAPATRKVYVHSTSLLVGANVVEEKLLKQAEFGRMGFVITRDPQDTDFVLELRHDVLTKYVFTVIDAKTLNVIAGGKLSSLGGTVAGKVAGKFVKAMSKQP